jgi:hypothetical protein
MGSSEAPVLFELNRGPVDDVVKLLSTLSESRGHHGMERLIVYLRCDVGPRRMPSYRGCLIAAGRIVVEGAKRRLYRFPGFKIVEALKDGRS